MYVALYIAQVRTLKCMVGTDLHTIPWWRCVSRGHEAHKTNYISNTKYSHHWRASPGYITRGVASLRLITNLRCSCRPLFPLFLSAGFTLFRRSLWSFSLVGLLSSRRTHNASGISGTTSTSLYQRASSTAWWGWKSCEYRSG